MRRALAIALVAVALTGCASRLAAAGAAAPTDDAAIVHVLSRLAFGPRPGDVERVKAIGLSAWIERQLDPARIDDHAAMQTISVLPTLTMTTAQLQREYPRPDPRQKSADPQMAPRELFQPAPEKRPIRIVAELQAARIMLAVESERQLQE
ncbi:MAG: DUF1800 domain-containing protein, partial [Candidatus Rokuibacteriota bacterium]